mgnify:CR=1 FL=1
MKDLSVAQQQMVEIAKALSEDAEVLMVAWMNREALQLTARDGTAVYWSRSRDSLWRKGETSGNVLRLVEAAPDCDGDTLLVRARPAGPTCHLGSRTCFEGSQASVLPGFLGELEAVIEQRLSSPTEGSYVARLVDSGRQRIAQKVGEEGVEFALSCVAEDREATVDEGADLLFHLMVALREQGLSLSDVIARLEARHRP